MMYCLRSVISTLYLVYSTTTKEETHFDDQVIGIKTFVYLNIWSKGDPTLMAGLVRKAM